MGEGGPYRTLALPLRSRAYVLRSDEADELAAAVRRGVMLGTFDPLTYEDNVTYCTALEELHARFVRETGKRDSMAKALVVFGGIVLALARPFDTGTLQGVGLLGAWLTAVGLWLGATVKRDEGIGARLRDGVAEYLRYVQSRASERAPRVRLDVEEEEVGTEALEGVSSTAKRSR